MRLSDCLLATTATMHVRDIAGRLAYNADGSPLTIELLPNDSEQVQAAERAALNRKLRNPQKLRMSAEELDEDGIEKLVAATVAWNTFEDDKGKPIECTLVNSRAIYKQHRWLREQVDAFVGERANFLPKSATS